MILFFRWKVTFWAFLLFNMEIVIYWSLMLKKQKISLFKAKFYSLTNIVYDLSISDATPFQTICFWSRFLYNTNITSLFIVTFLQSYQNIVFFIYKKNSKQYTYQKKIVCPFSNKIESYRCILNSKRPVSSNNPSDWQKPGLNYSFHV